MIEFISYIIFILKIFYSMNRIVQDRHVNMSFLLQIYPHSNFRYVIYFSFFLFQQLTGERKQMAKAMVAANKPARSSYKKRSSTPSSSAPPPKRRSFTPDKGIVCYNCQQPGHIAPRCPSRPNAASTPAAKPHPKK